MRIECFSDKQKQVLNWWCESSAYKNLDAIICDGAVRSGKTLCMGISFVNWAFYRFNKANFAICSKSKNQAKRNVFFAIIPILRDVGFDTKVIQSESKIIIRLKGRENIFYLFGGNDSSSASRIQGLTLSGVLFDEVALLNRDFVEQALTRCSVTGSKYWFNCNPEYPGHWFYREWIKKAKEKKTLYIHFLMQDNPSLSQDIIERYRRLYTSSFYRRYVLGKWVATSGVVYPFMEQEDMYWDCPSEDMFDRFAVSCDYGTVNPSSFGLWGRVGDVWYRIREYYYDSEKEGTTRTDSEHFEALLELIDGAPISFITVDPSAASFIAVIEKHSEYRVIPAKNDVLDGIGKVSTMLKNKTIRITKNCKDSRREFSVYRWAQNKNKDKPVKSNDHAMDDIRYFVSAIDQEETSDDFFVFAKKR